jgi:hypothetical protein
MSDNHEAAFAELRASFESRRDDSNAFQESGNKEIPAEELEFMGDDGKFKILDGDA